MNRTTLDELISRVNQAKDELESELDRLLAEKREQFDYTIRKGRVIFERNIRKRQRQLRTRAWRYVIGARLSFILTAPFIYGMVVPITLLDLTITIYQHLCFRVYGIPLVARKHYIRLDRRHLAYLNSIEKFNCVYCGYGNGVIAYAREITARTEQFWCPIKHASRPKGQHNRTDRFLDYGDADAWKEQLVRLREDLKNK